jgi:DNA end-binding protein Ku
MAAKRTPQDVSETRERAIWRGSISFGLVQIPVGLYRAESDTELHFAMLDKREHTPVRFDRICRISF